MTTFQRDKPAPDHVGRRARVVIPLASVTLAFAVSVGHIFSPLVTIAVTFGGLAAALAVSRTRAMVIAGILVVAFIPIYWAPAIPRTHVGILPVLPVCLVLLPRALRERYRLRITSVDWLMAGYVGLRILASLINSSRGAGAAVDALLYTAAPYAVFRLLGLDRTVRRSAAFGIVVAGVIASALGIREYSTRYNPFFKRFPNGVQHAYWTKVDHRFRHQRPEASFGHADVLGLFLAFAAVLAICLAWRETGTAKRMALYASVMVCLYGIADTLERGPIVFLLIAFPILLVLEIRRGSPSRVIAAVLGALVIFSATSFGATAFKLRDASSSGEIQASAEDRYATIRAMRDTRYFSVLGHHQDSPDELSAHESIGLSTGLGAVENAFMWTYLAYGFFAMIAFAAMAIPIGRAAFDARVDLLDRGWLAIVVSSFVIFLSVDLSAQFGHFFWMALGVGASIAQQRNRPAVDDALSSRNGDVDAYGGLDHEASPDNGERFGALAPQ